MLAIPCEGNDKREMRIGREKQEGWRGEEAGKHLRVDITGGLPHEFVAGRGGALNYLPRAL